MKKLNIFLTLSFLGILSCHSQPKPILRTTNPYYLAHEKAFIIPLNSVKMEINDLIDSNFSVKDRVKELSKKQFLISVFIDSCGNITEVSINDFPKGREYSLFEKKLKEYIVSLKKFNIYYRDKQKKLQYLDIVLLYIEFNDKGVIVDLH